MCAATEQGGQKQENEGGSANPSISALEPCYSVRRTPGGLLRHVATNQSPDKLWEHPTIQTHIPPSPQGLHTFRHPLSTTKSPTMISMTRVQAPRSVARQLKVATRWFAVSAQRFEASVSSKSTSTAIVEKHAEVQQAPNRGEIWSRSQQPRSEAMTGPRFEQTDFDLQVGCHKMPG